MVTPPAFFSPKQNMFLTWNLLPIEGHYLQICAWYHEKNIGINGSQHEIWITFLWLFHKLLWDWAGLGSLSFIHFFKTLRVEWALRECQLVLSYSRGMEACLQLMSPKLSSSHQKYSYKYKSPKTSNKKKGNFIWAKWYFELFI